MCIALVVSYSIDATNCLFTESVALRRGFFPPDPLVKVAELASRSKTGKMESESQVFALLRI